MRLEFSDANERRAVDPIQLIDDVEPAHQLQSGRSEFAVLPPTRELLFVGDVGTEHGEDPLPLLRRDKISAEAATRELGDLLVGEVAEALDHTW